VVTPLRSGTTITGFNASAGDRFSISIGVNRDVEPCDPGVHNPTSMTKTGEGDPAAGKALKRTPGATNNLSGGC